MTLRSASATEHRAEDVIGVFNALEDRLNHEFDAHHKLEEGFVRVNSVVKCDTEWSEMLQCHEELMPTDSSPNDKHHTYASAIEKCGDKNDAFLRCAQRERVNFMRRLGDMIDRTEASSNGEVV
eukprot:CAMPEP_0201530112 /NCGR_PEP_ID=MMETSP0161_2-20130828/43732_1 /ASSEMBLY_ACC=CAM_ASM_000251 /TAXON_ID=180227 /ORGANISM="Neoparamoeba aestuarina, Strain SoJaBio B1-5/56/2" /LENGTH=123 /DNA_ID=CAMNT_0047932281 /DNA_START=30 /DNA_END=398 /DNA_ORIENTATION=-